MNTTTFTAKITTPGGRQYYTANLVVPGGIITWDEGKPEGAIFCKAGEDWYNRRMAAKVPEGIPAAEIETAKATVAKIHKLVYAAKEKGHTLAV